MLLAILCHFSKLWPLLGRQLLRICRGNTKTAHAGLSEPTQSVHCLLVIANRRMDQNPVIHRDMHPSIGKAVELHGA